MGDTNFGFYQEGGGAPEKLFGLKGINTQTNTLKYTSEYILIHFFTVYIYIRACVVVNKTFIFIPARHPSFQRFHPPHMYSYVLVRAPAGTECGSRRRRQIDDSSPQVNSSLPPSSWSSSNCGFLFFLTLIYIFFSTE